MLTQSGAVGGSFASVERGVAPHDRPCVAHGRGFAGEVAGVELAMASSKSSSSNTTITAI